jgi:putative Ca2+/H+ antiporter (TMEM165/GDT1 family)
MSPLFLSTFALIFVAELPDKTAFATLLLATTGNPWAIFLGAASAFLIQSLVAVTCGSFLSALPPRWVHLGAGILFLLFAFLAWRRKAENQTDLPEDTSTSQKSFLKTVSHSFVIIFIAEWGDLTQLASASLVARYGEPITIFVAATLSLWTVTGIAIVIGNRAKKFLNPVVLNKVAAVAFSAVGAYFIYNWTQAR